MITPSAVLSIRDSQTPSAPAAGPAAPAWRFADVLSALNPLQYVPVVGTIYRAMTGDRPPEALRAMGGMIAGGLMGGPVGAAVSAASSFLQHVTGIDLDDLAHDAMASVGLVDATPVALATPPPLTLPPPVAAPTLARSEAAADVPRPAASTHWTDPSAASNPHPDPAQRQAALAAYGQTLFTYGRMSGHA